MCRARKAVLQDRSLSADGKVLAPSLNCSGGVILEASHDRVFQSNEKPIFQIKEIPMNKSTMSILLAAMMASSGLAVAQTADIKSGTQGGSGPAPAVTAAPGNMPNTRAEVKAQINPADIKSGTQGGAAPERGAAAGSSGDVQPNTRAGVKAQVNTNDIKSGTQGGATASPGGNAVSQNAAGTTSAERKAKRADRKAARKAKHKARNDTKVSGEAGMGQASAPAKEGKPAY